MCVSILVCTTVACTCCLLHSCRHWATENVIYEVLYTSDVRLRSNVVSIKFGVKYTGGTTHPYLTQEVPAVFVDRRFSVLVYYAGHKPWTDDDNVTYAFPGAHNMYTAPTERWAAYLLPDSGWGVGVFVPKAWLGVTAYRVGPDGSTAPSDCSYFAHTVRMQLHPGMQPFEYRVYVTVGRLNAIRQTFRRLAKGEAAAELQTVGDGCGGGPGSAGGATDRDSTVPAAGADCPVGMLAAGPAHRQPQLGHHGTEWE